jgi:hypothetical protein
MININVSGKFSLQIANLTFQVESYEPDHQAYGENVDGVECIEVHLTLKGRFEPIHMNLSPDSAYRLGEVLIKTANRDL